MERFFNTMLLLGIIAWAVCFLAFCVVQVGKMAKRDEIKQINLKISSYGN